MTGAAARRLWILDRLVDGPTPNQLCEVAAEVTEVSGAGIMLVTGDAPQGSICASDEVSALIEELHFSLGEGPGLDAFRHDRPALEPDLAGSEPSRWVAFASAAAEAGARAVFGFPLRVGQVRLGALTLYRRSPGPLSSAEHADALTMADIATRAVVAMQADASPGQLAATLGDSANFHYVVHQATGMVAAQLDVSVGQALVCLQAHAFGNDRPLAKVAADVVARRLRFDELAP